MTKEMKRKSDKELAKPRPPQPWSGITKAELMDGALTITSDETSRRLLHEAFGTLSPEFSSYAVGQLVSTLADVSKVDLTFSLKVALSQMAGIGPRNEMEAMAAIQMVCAHNAAIELTRRTIRTDRLDCKQLYGNLANKFSRTYLAQMDGLARLRRNGEQVVKHVHVGEGGQAVIAGTVNAGGRGA